MNQNQLTEGNIVKAMMSFAIPVLGALFLQALYGAVDLVIVGKFSDIANQSGVATGSMFTTTFGHIISAFALGMTVLIGVAMGEKEQEKVNRIMMTGILLFVIVSIFSIASVVLGSHAIAKAMNAPVQAFIQTSAYIQVCGYGLGFIIFYNVFAAIFRGLGDSKTPLITVVIACILNVLGDLLFVAIFSMGAKGAALATVLAQAFSVLCSIFFLMKREDIPNITCKDFKIHGFYLKKLILLGFPVALQELLVGFSFIFVQSTVNTIGVVESSGVGIAEKLCAFLMLVSSSYMQSMAAFCAQNNGAGRHDRAIQGLKIGIKTALFAGIMTGSLAFFAGDILSSIFTNDSSVILASYSYLKAYAIDCLLTSVLFCFIGYFNGNEHTLFVMIQGIVGAFCIRVPLVYIIHRVSNGNLFYIGLATPASSVVQILLCLVAYFTFEKRIQYKCN